MSEEKDNYIPAEPAGSSDEDVLAGIARQHTARLRSQQAEAAPLTEPPPVVHRAKPVELEVHQSSGLSRAESSGAAEEFQVRPAMRRSSRRGVSPTWRLIIQIAIVGALTALAVVLHWLTR